MFGSINYGEVCSFSIISQKSTDQTQLGQQGQPTDGRATEPSSVRKERKLNHALIRLLDFADRIMVMDDKDSNKWIGVKGLLEKMKKAFPLLLNADTSVELTFMDKRYGQKYEYQGELNYKQFIEVLNSHDELEKVYNHITQNQVQTLSSNKRKPLYAEVKLLLLYTALKYELECQKDFTELFDPSSWVSDGPRFTDIEKHPHFGKMDSESMQEHWAGVYHRLIRKGWLDGNEVKAAEWVYICCGKRKPPDGPVVWYGTTAALAHIVRTKLGSKWHLAHKIFCLPEGKKLPVSFNTTKRPAQNVVDEIEEAFSLAPTRTNSFPSVL